MSEFERPAPPHPRAESAEAALADVLALVTASASPSLAAAASSILAEYLVLPPSALLPAPRRSRAHASLVDLLAACAFLARLLRTLSDAPTHAACEVWAHLDDLEDHLEDLVTSGRSRSLAPEPLMLPQPHSHIPGAGSVLCGEEAFAAREWAAAAHRLAVPVDVPASAFALLRAGFEVPGAEDVSTAVHRCLDLCRIEPASLAHTAGFLVLLAARLLRALADSCAHAPGGGAALLTEVGTLLAHRRLRL